MALTQRQMNCFERNSQFLTEVASALLPIAAQMMKTAMVVASDPASTEVQQTFAAIHKQLADQILKEQGINVQGLGSSVTATSGSTAMKYLVQQMLMSPGWTMTPDEWAEDEMTARAAIQAGMAALLLELTAIPAPANS